MMYIWKTKQQNYDQPTIRLSIPTHSFSKHLRTASLAWSLSNIYRLKRMLLNTQKRRSSKHEDTVECRVTRSRGKMNTAQLT